jgi:hypothetical protein
VAIGWCTAVAGLMYWRGWSACTSVTSLIYCTYVAELVHRYWCAGVVGLVNWCGQAHVQVWLGGVLVRLG